MDETSIKIGKENCVYITHVPFLDHYEVLDQLGKGGYGKVYRVKNIKSGEIYACKLLSKFKIENLDKIKKEINILKKINHPNIIKLYEIFESKKWLYLIMEECKGGSLYNKIIELLQIKKMYTEKQSANIFRQIILAIEYCHKNGICHRDLKPENILYLYEGSEYDNPIKIIDFGLSKEIPPNRKLGSKVGSAYYVAPEVIKGLYTEKCDIWSAGVILYIILSGDPPFNGSTDNDIYNKILKMKFKFPDEKWINISNEAKDLITHMITPENERYNAKQVLEHPWFKSAEKLDLVNLHFDDNFFKNYEKSSWIKKISENEIDYLRKIFEAFNTEKDGKISINELKKGLLKTNNINENEINKLFETIDISENGKIDYTEFLAATLQKQNNLEKEKLFEAFYLFDKDKTGMITKEN